MSESAEIKNPVNNLIEEGTNWLDNINLPENYHPSDNEEYMSDLQLKYFWQKLANNVKIVLLKHRYYFW